MRQTKVFERESGGRVGWVGGLIISEGDIRGQRGPLGGENEVKKSNSCKEEGGRKGKTRMGITKQDWLMRAVPTFDDH